MEYETIELKDEENRQYTIAPTFISQVLGKIKKAIEHIEDGEAEVAVNFLQTALIAADNIIMEKIKDNDPGNWSGVKLEKIDYDSFWEEDDRPAEI